MRFILLGAPGAGKGTQADFLSQEFHIPKIATGDMLRQTAKCETPLGQKIKNIMRSGELVSDDIMIELVKDRISKPDCQDGFLLDGFPRTKAQAEALIENHIHIDYVLEIQVDDEEIVKRLSGRLTHVPSGRIYHRIYNPPKIDGKDDVTGEPLLQREDDKEETIRHRLSVYHEQTRPLVDFYKDLQHSSLSMNPPKFLTVSGMGTVDEVNQRIMNLLPLRNASAA